MSRSTFTRSFAFVLPLAAFSACGIFNEQKGGPALVNDLVGWVERVHVESELSMKKVNDSVRTLQAVVAGNFRGDPVTAYAELKDTIRQSEDQAVKLRASVENMKQAAGPIFEKWAADLGAFSNTDMRLRSEMRLAATRERYQAIVAVVDPAQSAYDAYNRGLRDHALFLGHDFNTASVTEIRGDAGTMTMLAAELGGRFEKTQQAARKYVQSAALPVSASPAPGGAGDEPETQKR